MKKSITIAIVLMSLIVFNSCNDVSKQTAGKSAFEQKKNKNNLTLGDLRWFQYDFGKGTARVIKSFKITSASNSQEATPIDWTFLGSKNGYDWSTIDKRTNELFTDRSESRHFNINNATAYQIYRLDIMLNRNSSHVNPVSISEFELFETPVHESISQSSYKAVILNNDDISYSFNNAFFIILLIAVGIVLNTAGIKIISRKISNAKLLAANSMLENRLANQVEEISQTQKISAKALAILAEYYDTDTGEHLARIQSYVELLCEWLKEKSHYAKYLSNKSNYIDDLKVACLLHDVGKIAIPETILTKPDKLTDEEFEVIKSHTSIAGHALTNANEDFRDKFNMDSYLALARDIATYHHEKWNGKGYPYGLAGEKIPLSARIVAIADVYDALRSKRPYKESWSHEKALNEIVDNRGEHFDPAIVDAFVSLSDQFKDISEVQN